MTKNVSSTLPSLQLTADRTMFDIIQPWRDMYRLEMNCQIIHDSLHSRTGWTEEYLLRIGETPVGYGSMAVAGPWKDQPALYEFYVVPWGRSRMFDLFRTLLEVSRPQTIEVQSNDVLATTMLHAFAPQTESDSILFHDRLVTAYAPQGAMFRTPTAEEAPADITETQRRWHGVIEYDGEIVASGGILFHYNRPYGDIYMEVKEPFRRRGFGSFLVQELKRVCYAGGFIPGARCNPQNRASQSTLQKAGFVPCGHILKGAVS